MKDISVRKSVVITLCCFAVMAFYSCQPEPDPVKTYSVKYDLNGVSDWSETSAPKDKHDYESGDVATVLEVPKGIWKDGVGLQYSLSWNTAADETGTTYFPGDKITMKEDIKLYARWTARYFNAANFISQTYYKTLADLRATGSHCVIYSEGTACVSNDVIQSVMKEFDESIYPKITGVYGVPYDVGVKDKTLLLLLDIKDGYSGSGGYVAGYFDSDMMSDKTISNKEDMLYLDTNPSDSNSLSFRETVAHEFQHLINYSESIRLNRGQQDVWINEGLSAAAEYIYSGEENTDWVKYYNEGKGAVAFGNNFYVWGGKDSWEEQVPDTVLDNYATVYLLFRWLGIQAGTDGTPDNTIYKRIISSTFTYNAVTDAVSSDAEASTIPHGSNIELIQEWVYANFYHKANGTRGYKAKISVTAPIGAPETPNFKAAFAPGEAMFYAIDISYDPWMYGSSGMNMKYFGLRIDSDNIDTNRNDGTGFTGTHVLVMNTNDNNAGGNEAGYVARVAKSDYLRSVQTGEYEQPESWVIDPGVMGAGGSSELTVRALEASRSKARVAPSLRKAY